MTQRYVAYRTDKGVRYYESVVGEIDAFLHDIKEVCVKHGLSISHEDSHGGFLVQKYDDDLMSWLLNADDNRDA